MTVTIKYPNEAPKSEFSERFVQGMADRMVVSFYKYGAVADAYPRKIDAIESLKLRLERYAQTGNTELLMDVANFAMIEFMHPRHERAHFKAEDSEASPGRVWNSGAVTQESNTLTTENKRKPLYAKDGD